MKSISFECEFDVLARVIAWMVISGLLFFATLGIFSTSIISAYSFFVAGLVTLCECSCMAWACGFKKEEGSLCGRINSEFVRSLIYGLLASGGLAVYAYVETNYFLMVLYTVLLIDSGLYLILGCQSGILGEAQASTQSFGHGVGPVMY
eukprot:g2931.t1